MNKIKYISVIILLISSIIFAQGFNISTKGTHTFSFTDSMGRNQTTFFSETPLEDITGTASDVSGSVTFNVDDISTMKGMITVKVASINTGIELRNNHLRSANWLNAETFPGITFEIIKVESIQSITDTKLKANVIGSFSVHGVAKQITAETELQYLVESEQTKKRAPGDLLGVNAKFKINLSDYGVENSLIGNKVAENIDISVNIVGSNAVQ